MDIPAAEPIRKAIVDLDGKIARLKARLAETQKQREALSGTLDYFYPKKTAQKRSALQIVVNPDELRSKTLDQALLHIAELNDGTVVSTSAREALMEAGILRGNQATASAALCDALSSSDQFRRESKGRYVLIVNAEPNGHGHVNGTVSPHARD